MPLGLEDRRIADPTMTASTYYNFYLGPWNGRLHSRREGRRGASWSAKRKDTRQWLKVDFGALTRVSRVATQGRQNAHQWVKTYSISYSRKGVNFVPYKEKGRLKVHISKVKLSDTLLSFRINVLTWDELFVSIGEFLMMSQLNLDHLIV